MLAGDNAVIIYFVNAIPILRLATVDALAVFSPSLSYIDIVSGGWFFVLLGYTTSNPRTYGRRNAGRTLALIHVCTADRPPYAHWL